MINNKNIINERRFKKNKDIKKYIEYKKKLVKINDEQKKKKGEENDLRKFLELYNLQKNAFNSINIKALNDKYLSKTKNDFYCGKNINKSKNKNYKKKNNNNNINSKEILTSSESTIVDKTNYYQNILDIQSIYNDDYLFINNENELNDILIKNSNNKKFNINDDNAGNISNLDKINKNKGKKDNNKIELNEINIDINDDNKNNNLNKINDEEIYEKCQNTLEKANKIIGGNKVESLINNFKNIRYSNEENIIQDNNNIPLYDYKNDYSFKLNESNSNEINSVQTSKFCTSQAFLEEKKIEEKEVNNDIDIKENIDKNNINKDIIDNNTIKEQTGQNIFTNNSFKKEDNYSCDNNEIKDNMTSIQLPPTIQLISGNNSLEDENKNNNKVEDINGNNKNKDKDNSIKNKLSEEKLENYKEILTSLFEYLKLITQRNALNDIITYGDMKYKYKIGFEQIIILIKSIPFNIIRAIQQSQYYNFVFRQLFIPYISKAFHKIKIYSSYNKFFIKYNQIMNYIFKKIIFRRIRTYRKKEIKNNIISENQALKENINTNLKSINSELTIKSLEDIAELKDLNQNKVEKKVKKKINDSKNSYNYSEKDISESKELDSIEWDNNFINEKQITNRDNSNIINNFTKIYKNDNSYSADFNIDIKEIVFEDENQ